ncbi:glycosyltransferase family 2 protein [Candidatus Microgenomates bacterium]|nr:glycosyltransferase family 2 protein [Candidatus Microgenomates bacterium]
MKTLIIVPAFNEVGSLAAVIADLRSHGYKNLVVVDDGSLDESGSIAKNLGVMVLTHSLNRGLGAALGTGWEYAKLVRADFVVTFDSDRQHRAADIKKLLAPLTSGCADVAIGSRLLSRSSDMPWDRLIISYLSNLLTFILYGIRSTDSQSGLRAFNKKALNCITIKTDRMEVSSEFLKEIKRNKLRFREIPIKPIYTQYSRQGGQGNLNSFAVAAKMFLRLFR